MSRKTNIIMGLLALTAGTLGVLGSFSSTFNNNILNLRIAYYVLLNISCFYIYSKFIFNRVKQFEYLIFLILSAIAMLLSIMFSIKLTLSLFTLDISSEANNYIILGQIKRGAFFALPVIVTLSFYNLSELFKDNIKKLLTLGTGKEKLLLLASLTLFWANIALYSPLTVLTSSAGTFSIALGSTVFYYLIVTIIFILVTYFALKILKSHRKIVLISIIALASLAVWIYTYILPGDYGNLDGTILTKAKNLKISTKGLVLELGCLIVFSILFYTLLVKKAKILIVAIVILNIMSLSQLITNIISYVGESSRQTTNSKDNELDERLFSFSKDNENVVVLMLDMFCGGFIPEILESKPSLEQDMDGFVWYPNTISISNNTFTSVPSILGGSDFTPDTMNSKGTNLREQYKDAYLAYYNKLAPEGYDVSMGGLYYLQDRKLFSDRDIPYFSNKEIYSEWKSKPENQGALNKLLSPNEFRNIFIAIGLFKASPLMFRSTIYYDSRWLNLNQGGMTIDHVLESRALLELLPEVSTADSNNKTFKYFVNNLSHMPWGIDEKGNLSKNYIVNTPEFVKKNGTSYVNPELVRNTSMETLNLLTRWFNWMKETGVYDNTKIVIVSDHGISGLSPMFEDFSHVTDSDNKPVFPTGRIHPIMLVKDFNNRGKLKTSDKFLSNSDTFDIATSVVEGYDPIVDYNPDRKLKLFTTPWKISSNKPDAYIITGEYTIEKSIFNKDNWSYKYKE